MADNLDGVKAEIEELRKAIQASPASKGGKDIWEKLGTFSTLFSSVILGAVGLFATYVFNQHQLEQQRQDSQEKARIERAQVLDRFWHYVVSAEPREREFGYAMFAYFDQADLALKLIALKKDQAGAAVVESLKQSSDAGVRSAALQTLLTLQQEENVRKLLIRPEGSSYDYIGDIPILSDKDSLIYGIGEWGVRNGRLFKLLDAYTQRPNAQYAAQVKSLIAAGTVVKTPELISTLKTVSADPVMRQTQDDFFRAEVIEPAVSMVRGIGLRLPLSIAVVCDAAFSSGLRSVRKLAEQATVKSGSDPANGGDEKRWTQSFLDARSDDYKSLPSYAKYGKVWEARVEALRQIAKNGDWMLTTAGNAETAIARKQD